MSAEPTMDPRRRTLSGGGRTKEKTPCSRQRKKSLLWGVDYRRKAEKTEKKTDSGADTEIVTKKNKEKKGGKKKVRVNEKKKRKGSTPRDGKKHLSGTSIKK